METNVSGYTHKVGYLSGGICWKSIFAGAITAAVTSLVLLTLASGLGLAALSPFSGDTESIASFTVKIGVLMVVMQWVSSAFGGYIAGRLSSDVCCDNVHPQETFFRDYAHGFLTWAVATLLTVILLTSAVTSIVSGGVQAATAISAGAAAGASKEEVASVSDGANSNAYYIDSLFRSANVATPQGANDVNGEAARIFAMNSAEETFAENDRQYLISMVSARTGVSTEEATARVDQTIAKFEEVKQEAFEVAERTRKASSAFSLFTTLSLLAGAFIASVAATCGSVHRRRGYTN